MEGKPEEITKKKFWKCTCEMFHTCNNRYNEGLITAGGGKNV